MFQKYKHSPPAKKVKSPVKRHKPLFTVAPANRTTFDSHNSSAEAAVYVSVKNHNTQMSFDRLAKNDSIETSVHSRSSLDKSGYDYLNEARDFEAVIGNLKNML